MINEKYYYGIHSTNNLDDGYIGTGTALKCAIKKHGKENFLREIIADYPTRKEASDHEKLVVDSDMINDPMCYNCMTGGNNEYVFTEEVLKKMSDSHIGKKMSEETRRKMSIIMSGSKHPMFGKTGEMNPNFGKKSSKQTKKILSDSKIGELNPMFGKTHSDEAKKKIGEAQIGEKNHNFGKSLSEETKSKLSAANSGENNPQFGKTRSEEIKEKLRHNSDCKPCQILGIVYISMSEASRRLGMSKNAVSKRLRSDIIKFSEWFYLEAQELGNN